MVSYFLKETESISNTVTNFCDVKLESSNCTSENQPSNFLGKVETVVCGEIIKHNIN